MHVDPFENVIWQIAKSMFALHKTQLNPSCPAHSTQTSNHPSLVHIHLPGNILHTLSVCSKKCAPHQPKKRTKPDLQTARTHITIPFQTCNNQGQVGVQLGHEAFHLCVAWVVRGCSCWRPALGVRQDIILFMPT